MPESAYLYNLSNINEPNEDKGLEELIQEVFEENKEIHGYWPITEELKTRSHNAIHIQVLRLMRKLGI